MFLLEGFRVFIKYFLFFRFMREEKTDWLRENVLIINMDFIERL